MALRIVVVDDDEKLAELLRVNFELDERFELVGWAANGREGIDLVREAQPDAVLMDLNMPVLDGIAATRTIVEADPQACVIAFTASDEHAEHEAASMPEPRRCSRSRSTRPAPFLDAFETHARRCTDAPTPPKTSARGRSVLRGATTRSGEPRGGKASPSGRSPLELELQRPTTRSARAALVVAAAGNPASDNGSSAVKPKGAR